MELENIQKYKNTCVFEKKKKKEENWRRFFFAVGHIEENKQFINHGLTIYITDIDDMVSDINLDITLHLFICICALTYSKISLCPVI